jgi:FkbM family methyltransferase
LKKIEEIVIAEPEPSNLSLLKRNCAPIDETTVLSVALDERGGSGAFTVSTEPNEGKLTSESDSTEGETIEVECRRITRIIPKHWDMDRTWLKLDIEGAEYGVLEELLRSKLRPAVISAELHDYLNRGGRAMVDALVEEGYEVTVEGEGDRGYVCRQIIAERKTV